MAARESQGIQIALIIFVILTVALGVSTYLFFDKFQQENLKIAGFEKEKQDAQKVATGIEKDLRTIAGIITSDTSGKASNTPEKFSDLATRLVAEHEKINAEFLGSGRTVKIRLYPDLVVQTKATLQQISGLAGTLQEKNIALEKTLADIQQGHETQIAAVKSKLGDEKTRYDTIETTYVATTNKSSETIASSLQQIEKLEDDISNRDSGSLEQIKQKNQMIATMSNRIAKLEDEIKRLRPELVEVKSAQGQVTRVNTIDKTAHINLGSQDGLLRRVRFLIFANDDTAIDEARAKAVLDVTEIIDEHTAIGSISKAELTNPVLPDDRIYSQTWRRGQRVNFALAGWMDMDGDGRSDRAKVAAYITQNGGNIVAQVLDDGNITDKLPLSTDFLILGDDPTGAKGNPAALKGYNDFVKTADKNGTKKLDFRKYLISIGLSVVDKEGESKDFRTREPGKKAGAYP